MITIKELHEQNHQIAELAKTLSYLFQEREMCDTSIACELFERYRDKFETHMKNNREVYSVLLNQQGSSEGKVAERFLAGEKEMKKLFKHFTHKWCEKGLNIVNHAEFLEESSEMFELVWGRIQAENEQLYPLIHDNAA
jgi:hypothetical protein